MSFFRRTPVPRPVRVRRVCEEPKYTRFVPTGAGKIESRVLTIEEYEVIRHVDYQKETHEECAGKMAISRTTVTEIYENSFNTNTLKRMKFEGNAPQNFEITDTSIEIQGDFTVYYHEGAEGFTSPKWYGYPTELWYWWFLSHPIKFSIPRGFSAGACFFKYFSIL